MSTRTYSDTEFELLKRWLDSNQDSHSEKITSELIEIISNDYPAKRILPVNSCMGALHIALQTIGVGPGDEVIVDPIVTFAGMAVMYHNAVPVFADVDVYKMNVEYESIKNKITERTKAIICTHLFGSMCEMENILRIAEEFNLPVIEDCAHTLFATRNGKYAGLYGDFAGFSFNHRKQLSTGQGGFLLINNEEFAEKSMFTSFGRIPGRLSWNYQISGLVSALAIAQWAHAKDYVKKDHELAALYTEALENCDWIVPQKIADGNWSAYHIWAAVYQGDEKGIDYKNFLDVLRKNGGDYFLPAFMPYGAFGLEPSPVYRYPIFNEPKAYTRGCPVACPHYKGRANYDEGSCPNAEYLVPRMFNTVISPVEDERVKRYAEALNKTVRYFQTN
jgi:dTDP-4-amino-4,6-dideoxygalactose transaminase